MSTKLSRINWPALAATLTPHLPDLHFLKTNPNILDVHVISKDPDVMPQLMFLIGNRFKPIMSTETGKYSFAATSAEMVRAVQAQEVTWDGTKNSSPISFNALRGMLMLMKINPRGVIMPAGTTQSKAPGTGFCSFVPLILAAWKRHQKIKYSEWDWQEPLEARRKLLDKDFAEYSEYFNKPEVIDQFSVEELQQFRDQARVVASTGRINAPEATAIITKQRDPAFKSLPKLLQFSLLQLWACCPHLWNESMVTNILSLDEPLVSNYSEFSKALFEAPSYNEPTSAEVSNVDYSQAF